jgi:hypothetical protein
MKQTSTVQPSAPLKNWNAFIDGGVDLGDLDHNIDESHASYTTGRVRAGADILLSSDFRLGALFAYSHTGADLDNEGSHADVNSYTPGLFAAYADKKGFYANACSPTPATITTPTATSSSREWIAPPMARPAATSSAVISMADMSSTAAPGPSGPTSV